MRRTLIAGCAVLLLGCQQQRQDERVEVADVNARRALARVSDLERRVSELEGEIEDRSAPAAIAPDKAREIKEAEDKFILTGPASLTGTGTRFPSGKRCEAARVAVVQQANERAQRLLKEQGIMTVGEPQLACMPL